MVNSQEIIERSIYSALLGVAVKLGYSVNPEDFLPINAENSKKFKEAISKLKKFVQVFGTGNNQSKDKKETPRIVVNARGFYPGSIGLPRELITKEEGIGFTATEYPYETIDQYIDIHLVAGTQEDLRLLHQIMFYAIPQRGYIKPYTEDSFLFTGNIFIELVNFFDIPNLDMGLLEKIYQFQVMDCILEEIPGKVDFVPITTIDVLLENYGYTLLEVPKKELPPIPPPIEKDIVYGSGKKFPIWNSMAGTDKIKSFKLLGYTIQEGMPTPEAPVPLLSVGDGGLKLCISDSETSIALQVVDFGDIVLRSLPNGVCDSIEWDGKQWKYIQRIEHIYIDGNINITKIVSNTNLNISYVNIPVSIVNGQNVKPYSSMYCNRKLYRKNGYNIADSIFTVDANMYFYITYLNDTGEPYTSDDIKAINDEYPLDIYYAINEPIETILEDLPTLQTFDNETWFGTPSALVKPYMMCECKVKKVLKYQGNITAWWYFGGNKSNETDRQITDISGNGNDLTPYNFAWTRESGWNQGGIYGDGIDDYLIYNEELSIENILIITSEFENKSGSLKYVLGFRSGNNNGGLCITINNRMGSANSYLASSPNNVLPEPLNYLSLTNNVSNYSSGISLLNFFSATGYCSNGNLHEVILFGNYLTDSEYDNNLKVAKQRNGVDGDINIG